MSDKKCEIIMIDKYLIKGQFDLLDISKKAYESEKAQFDNHNMFVTKHSVDDKLRKYQNNYDELKNLINKLN